MDPRFTNKKGQYNPVQFSQNYSFLDDMRKNEIKTVRKQIRKLKKKGKDDTEEAMKLKHILSKNKGDLKKSARSKKVIEARRLVRKEMEKNGFVNSRGKFLEPNTGSNEEKGE